VIYRHVVVMHIKYKEFYYEAEQTFRNHGPDDGGHAGI
jgi:hypothetical protein